MSDSLPRSTVDARVVSAAAPTAPGPLRQALAILGKDLRAELRNRAAVNAILLFSITAMVVIGFAVGGTTLTAQAQAALLWVVLFFAAFAGLAHVFLHEEEASTAMALRLSAAPGAVYAGKLLFNLLLVSVIAVIVAPLYVLMLAVKPAHVAGFLLSLVAGLAGLGAAATIVAAIIAKANGKGALYGALGFPILLPLLFMAVDATRVSLLPAAPEAALVRDTVGLISFAVMLVTASALLFPFVWEE